MNRSGARTAAPVVLAALCVFVAAARGALFPFPAALAALVPPGGPSIAEGWLPSLDEGLKAGRASGNPVLVVTIWPDDQ